jgi:hypothetical protein
MRRRFASGWALGVLLVVGSLCSAWAASATTITILNADPPNVGFNDPTPVAPVGGNPGTTIGAQRLNAIQHAADLWAGILDSDVEILASVTWTSLTCDPTSGFLGFAGPVGIESDFSGAEYAATWYPVSLANKLAMSDIDPGNPDIQAQFNLDVGTAGCLTDSEWYYGLDNNATPLQFDLVTTALHELAHGLGSLEFVNDATGEFLGGQVDVYSRFIYDNTQSKLWTDMTNAERAASATNFGNVIWDGPFVNAAVPSFLGNRPILEVNAPVSVAGTYAVGTAVFGPPLTLGGVTGDLVLVDDGVDPASDACEPIVNGAQLVGNIAMIDRGSCTFTSKIKAAQDNGAIGVVIVNHTPAAGVITMGGTDPTITIPSVMISFEDGNALKAELLSGVNVSLILHPTLLAGADDSGKALLYAPNPIASGSSISHWDLSANPDLLMEPNIPEGIPQDGDLTVPLFHDIGWFPDALPIIVEEMNILSAEDALVLTWQFGPDSMHDLAGVGIQRAHDPQGPFENLTAALLEPMRSMSYEDLEVEAGTSYWYRLMLVDHEGQVELSRIVQTTFEAGALRTALMASYEESSGEVKLRYRVGQRPRPVRLEIYDVSGRHLRTLDQGTRNRGEYAATWDRRDTTSSRVGRGIYFIRMVAGTTVASRKMVLVR